MALSRVRRTVLSVFLGTVILYPGIVTPADAQPRGLTESERACVETVPDIVIEPPLDSWLSLNYGTMGQIVMFKTPKGSHMVSKGGFDSFNLFPEMDPQKLGQLVSEVGCVAVRFQALVGGTLLDEFAAEILPMFESVFEEFKAKESVEVHMLQAVGYDSAQETTLFFVTDDKFAKYAVFSQPWKQSVTAWELIDGEEWRKRANRRILELEAMSEMEKGGAKN